MQIAEVLEKRLNTIIEASTDIDCFKHVHSYIKYVLTTPELKNILDAEEKNFYKKVQFTNDNIKLERSNFYQAYFVTSFVRIYSPIEHYFNSSEPDEKQDPVALLLIWGIDHPRTKRWVNRHEFFSKRHRMKELKSYWRWFDGCTQDYVDEIKNLHLELLTALSRNGKQFVLEASDELPLELDLETGDFNFGKQTGTLNITTQEFRILTKLYIAGNHQVEYLELIKCINPRADRVTKPDKASLAIVIRNIKEQLGILPKEKRVNADIFQNVKGVGYRLISNR